MLRQFAAAAALICSMSIPAAAQTSSPARAQIVKFVHDYTDANNRAEVNAMLEMTSHDSSVSSIANGAITRGWEAIRKDTDELVGQEGSFRVSVGSMDIVMLGSANALVVAPVTMTIATPNGPAAFKGAMTLVLEKKGKSWLLLNEHYSVQQPGA